MEGSSTSAPGRLWSGYQRFAEMPRIPTAAELHDEFTARGGHTGKPSESEVADAFFGELDAAQATIDNRAEATVKLNAFALAGVTALSKVDGGHATALLATLVLVFAGAALVCALMATTPVFVRKVLLRAPVLEDVRDGCGRLERNQWFLALATGGTIVAGVLSVAVIVVSLWP